MDFQFITNPYHQPEAKCSMEHEAFGLWLTEEISSNRQKLHSVLQALEQIHSKQRRSADINGKYYHLRLTCEDAIVRASHAEFMESPEHLDQRMSDQDVRGFSSNDNSVLTDEDHFAFSEEESPFHDDIDPDELSVDDQQGSAMCGLEDFHAMLLQWQAFVQSHPSL